MKKSIFTTLLMVCILAISTTAFAGPFADVPAKHWAYAAVTKLANAGIVDGVDGKYLGERTITRYEMAQIVAKAMERSNKADAENRALINKLATEFAAELNSLGVRVSALENKIDNVKFTGEVRARYDNYNHAGTKSSGNSYSYLDLWATAQINDTWVAKAEMEGKNYANDSTKDNTNNTTKVYATGPAFGGNLTLGKFDPFTAYGLVMDDNMSGAMFEFGGKKVQARVACGKINVDTLGSVDTTTSYDTKATVIDGAEGSKYALAEMDIALSPVTNVKAAYHRINLDTTYAGKDSVTYYEGGFDSKLSKNFGVMATASKSNVEVSGVDNKGYLAQIQYKKADTTKPGSYDIYYNNRKIPTLAEIDSTWDYSQGVKGNQVGFEYVPMANTKVTAFYLKGNLVSDSSDFKVYRAQVSFFF